jgi:hypothetical protein
MLENEGAGGMDWAGLIRLALAYMWKAAIHLFSTFDWRSLLTPWNMLAVAAVLTVAWVVGELWIRVLRVLVVVAWVVAVALALGNMWGWL